MPRQSVDSWGKIILSLSTSCSQDGAGLFYLKMTVLVKNSTNGPVAAFITQTLVGGKGQVLPSQVSAYGLVLSGKNCFHLCDKLKVKLSEIINVKLLCKL